MTKPDEVLRQELQTIEAHLARVLDQAQRIEARRDQLILALADAEGCHQGRPTAVR